MTTRVAAELPHLKKLRLGELLGFILGDGSLGKTNNGVSFSNSEAYCISKILEDFSYVFGVKRGDFNYYLNVPLSSDVEKIVDFWVEKVGNEKILVTKGLKTKKKFGWLIVRIHDRALKRSIGSGIERILAGEEEDGAVLLGFLKGFFAAEGTVIPGKVRKQIPNSIQFPQKGKKIPVCISKILDSFGIENRVVIKQRKADYYCVNITGFGNFERFLELGISDLHPEKSRKISHGLKSYKKIVPRKLKVPRKLLRELSKRPMTRMQMYEFLDSYPQRVNAMIYSKSSYLVKNRLIEKETAPDGNIFWKITEKGLESLQDQKGY